MKRIFLAFASAGVLAVGSVPEAYAAPSCPLSQPNSSIKQVVFLQFDNTHLSRDNSNVPSDLEQMPTLYNFMKDKGTLGSKHHTVLISHTAAGIISTLTGVYPDRTGTGVSNSFNYYKTDGTAPFISMFGYWTNIIPDGAPLMVNELGKIAPAPWVPFTRAGCDVGNVSVANTVLENNTSDVANVFGANSPEASETLAQKTADFVGIAIHCAKGASSICAASGANPKADPLPDELGGYNGFQALYGHKYVAPVINGGSTAMTDLLGGSLNGYPGFDGMFPKVTGAYVAKMLEAGVQVAYGYISDAHDRHPSGPAFGPGSAGYVAQLQEYEHGFQAFFNELKAHGIDETNTLFVITADEGDHFAGKTKTGCDGVTTPCVYGTGEVGELLVRVDQLLSNAGVTTSFGIHFDMAPAYYLNGNPSATDPVTRRFEKALADLTIFDPYLGTEVPLSVGLADRASMKLLHMLSGDPLRTPTVVSWNEPNAWVQTTGGTGDVSINPAFAWMHGGIQPEIARTWLGLIGPGVKKRGIDDDTWTDHTDVRPTILALLGLHDDYTHDGRVIVEQLDPEALSEQIHKNRGPYQRLATVQATQRSIRGIVGGEHQILDRADPERQRGSLQQLSRHDGGLHRPA